MSSTHGLAPGTIFNIWEHTHFYWLSGNGKNCLVVMLLLLCVCRRLVLIWNWQPHILHYNRMLVYFLHQFIFCISLFSVSVYFLYQFIFCISLFSLSVYFLYQFIFCISLISVSVYFLYQFIFCINYFCISLFSVSVYFLCQFIMCQWWFRSRIRRIGELYTT